MLHLNVTLKDRLVLRRELNLETVRVGRAPTNEVALESMAISREHCVFRRDPRGTWTVQDLGSANGTFLNGARVAQAELRTGDAVSVGPFTISIRAGGAEAAPPLGLESPELRELGAPLKGRLLPQAPPGPPVLLERDLFQLGADPALDLVLQGPRKQALIVRGHGGFQVVNVGPDPAAVRVEGAPVPDRAWLRDGARLQVGGLAFTFEEGAEGEGEKTLAGVDLNALRLDPRRPPG